MEVASPAGAAASQLSGFSAQDISNLVRALAILQGRGAGSAVRGHSALEQRPAAAMRRQTEGDDDGATDDDGAADDDGATDNHGATAGDGQPLPRRQYTDGEMHFKSLSPAQQEEVRELQLFLVLLLEGLFTHLKNYLIHRDLLFFY